MGGFLFDILVLLGAAVMIVPLLRRAGVPSILGFLAAGLLLSPHTPGPVVDSAVTKPVAEFGIVFLLFAIGLELPLSRLRAMRRFMFGLGAFQVVGCALIFGAIAAATGAGAPAAIIIGITLALSSTAAVLAILVERNEAVTIDGRVSVAVLIFQDLAVVPVLALLPLLAHGGSGLGVALALAAGKAILAVGGIYAAGRFIVRPVYHFIAETRIPEVFTATNLLLVLAVAWIAEEAGMSMALGAFLAGILLSDSAYRHQVESDIEPFRGLLLGLFFMSVGMSMDLPFIGREWAPIVGITVGMLAVKSAVIIGLSVALGLGLAHGIRIGLLLSQVGEFGFVVFGKAIAANIIEAELGQMLIGATALSMVLTPALGALGRRLSRRLSAKGPSLAIPQEAETLDRHVVVAGYGRVGRAIGRVLTARGVPFVALDLDAEAVATARKIGIPAYFADATQAGVLRSVGVIHALAVVVTANNPKSVERTVAAVHDLAPQTIIIARAHDTSQEGVLIAAGATAVIHETLEVSLQMARLILRASGASAGECEKLIGAERATHYSTSTLPS